MPSSMVRPRSLRNCRDAGFGMGSTPPEDVEPERQHGAEPDRMFGMVDIVVAGLRVQQDGQAVAVEHQPGQERAEERARKRDLVHRMRMRPDQRVVPAAERRRGERRRHPLAQPGRPVTGRRRIVIDVGVIGRDDRGIHGRRARGLWVRHGRLLVCDRRCKGAKVIDKFYQDCRQWKRATNAGSQDAMTNYLLVSFKTCPWVQRAAIVLREKKVDFEFRHIEPDNRPDWFLAISPHKKVPVLRIDDKVSLFESNAIAEYLDETIAPRLHPAEAAERAVNRAWTDYIPTFAQSVTGCAYAETEADFNKAIGQIPAAFERLETALAKQGSGPFFNGTAYALPATRPSCSAMSSWTASASSATSRNFRASRRGPTP